MNTKIYIAPSRRKASEALAAEQMSFKFFRKCVRGQRGSPQNDGQAVPSRRTRHCEVSPTSYNSIISYNWVYTKTAHEPKRHQLNLLYVQNGQQVHLESPTN